MPSYIGEYHVAIDRKWGRVVIPNDLRYEMDSYNQKIFYLLRGTRENVLMIPSQLWEDIVKEFSKEPILNPTSQIALSYLIGASARIQIDNQYRMTLPGWVRQHAGINDTAVLVGCGEYLEIWNENKWDAFVKSGETRKLIERLLAKLFPSRFDEEMKKSIETEILTTRSDNQDIPQSEQSSNDSSE